MSINHDFLDVRINKLLQGGELFVELGCGAGFVLDEMMSKYKQVIGFDVSDVRLKDRGQDFNWEFRVADLNDRVPLSVDTVDVLYANQVIEHIINPIEFLKEIKRVLKPGGTAIITTPNIRYIRHIIRLITSGYGPRTANNNIVDGAWDDGHLHYFTHSDLAIICEELSFAKYYSQGFVRNHSEGLLRTLLDKYSDRYFVREFFTGNIFLIITK